MTWSVRSCRAEPIKRSTRPFCQGERTGAGHHPDHQAASSGKYFRISSPSWYPLAAGGDAAGCGALGRVARRRGATPMQVAIAWLLARSRVIVPIPGTSSVAHLDENVAAARILLSTEDLHELS